MDEIRTRRTVRTARIRIYSSDNREGFIKLFGSRYVINGQRDFSFVFSSGFVHRIRRGRDPIVCMNFGLYIVSSDD